MYQCKK